MLTSYLALDVGRARIGVAVANVVARIAAPLPVLENDDDFIENLQKILAEHIIAGLVVGWPRNLEGNATDQTRYVDAFIKKIEKQITIPVYRQDEAVTSVRAENELQSRGKSFNKGDIDSLSAVYILEDFLVDKVH